MNLFHGFWSTDSSFDLTIEKASFRQWRGVAGRVGQVDAVVGLAKGYSRSRNAVTKE